MGLTFLTGYILGQHGAQSARLAASAGARNGASASDLHDVHERVDRLILVVDAMWSLLEESGYTDDQLLERIERIDSEDGAVDGRRRPPATPCRECGTKVLAGTPMCQFCGADVIHPDPGGPTTGI